MMSQGPDRDPSRDLCSLLVPLPACTLAFKKATCLCPCADVAEMPVRSNALALRGCWQYLEQKTPGALRHHLEVLHRTDVRAMHHTQNRCSQAACTSQVMGAVVKHLSIILSLKTTSRSAKPSPLCFGHRFYMSLCFERYPSTLPSQLTCDGCVAGLLEVREFLARFVDQAPNLADLEAAFADPTREQHHMQVHIPLSPCCLLCWRRGEVGCCGPKQGGVVGKGQGQRHGNRRRRQCNVAMAQT